MKRKRLLITLLTLVTALCMAFSFACADKESGGGGLPSEPTPTASGWTYEFMSDVVIPTENVFEGVSGEDMLDGSVTYRFKSPEYVNAEGETVKDVIESAFPNVYLNRVGEWTVVYFRGQSAVAKTFNVTDTVAPKIEFESTAYDVFVEVTNEEESGDEGYEAKYKKYNLPSASAKDLSGININSRVDEVKLHVSESDPAYDENNPIVDLSVDAIGRYAPTATGKVVYTISVEDNYGNKSEETLTWNVKTRNWTDTELSEGYLADYDDAGYINSVEQGWVASYWADSQLYEEWFEEFEGATGVLKVSAAPNKHAQGCFQYNLPGAATEEDLQGKQLMLKLYTPNDIEYLYFGCKTYDQVSDMKHAFRINIVPNEWNYIAISSAELNYGTFNRGDEEIDQFSICFGTYSGGYKMSEDCILYIDSVTIAESLDPVDNVTIDGDVLNWSEVEGATGYEVMEGNTVTVVESTACAVTDKMAKIGVRAITTNPLYISQSTYTPFIDVASFGPKDLALFNTPSYEFIAVKNPHSSARAAADIKAEYLESYKGVENVLKVTSTTNNVLGTTGIGDITLMLPKASNGGITIKMLVEQSDADWFQFFQPGTEYTFDDVYGKYGPNLADVGNWQTLYIDYTKAYSTPDYARIDIMIQGGSAGSENVVYFAIVQDGDTVMDLEMKDVTETLKEDELAVYDSDRYLITTATDSCPVCGGVCDRVVNYSIVESFTDSNGVAQNGLLKIDVTNCSERSDAGWVLKLLKEHSGTYTIRYLVHVEDGDTNTATIVTREVNALGGVVNNENGINITTDVWHTTAITTKSANKKMVSMYNYGPSAKFTLYVDGIWDGDKIMEFALSEIKGNLGEDELAMYDDERYTLTLDAMYSPYQGSDYKVTASYLESFADRDGVIKINVVADKDGHCADFVLNLLNEHTGTYTIKYYIEMPSGSAAPAALQIKKSNSYGVKEVDPDYNFSLINGIWQTAVITTTSELKDALYFYMYGPSANFNIYIDGIWNGDQSAEEDPSKPDIFA